MKKRSIIYFRRKHIMKKLGCTTWHLDWIAFTMPPKGTSSMAMMLPAGPLRRADGTFVAPDPDFMPAHLPLSHIDEMALMGFIHHPKPLPTLNIHYHEIPMKLDKSTQDYIDLQQEIMDRMMSDILLKKETIIHIKEKPDNNDIQ